MNKETNETEHPFFSFVSATKYKVGVFHTGGYSRESIIVQTLSDLIGLINQKECKIIIHKPDYKDYYVERLKNGSNFFNEDISFYTDNDIFIEVYDDYRE